MELTKQKAIDRLDLFCQLIFEIESVMNVNSSHVRRLGYDARIAVSRFKDAIRDSKEEELKDIK